jgi:tetratricopeptide (TPR) repeat protein
MRLKQLLIICFLFLSILHPALHGEQADREFILKSMIFPDADIVMGNLINEPFFILNLQAKKTDVETVKKNILKTEKDTGKQPNAVDLFTLAGLYKEIHEYEKAVKFYKACLEILNKGDNNDSDYAKELVIKGDLHFALAEIDLITDRTGNLERASYFYKSAVEIKSETVLWIKLGDCYLALNKNNEALYSYMCALEKEKKINAIYERLQLASFQIDYLKLLENNSWDKIKNLQASQLTDFEYIQTAVNNSKAAEKELIKLQHYVYFMRLLLVKNEYYRLNNPSIKPDLKNILTSEEISILNEAESCIAAADRKGLKPSAYCYLKGIIYYLRDDYKNAVLNFEQSIEKDEYVLPAYKDLMNVVLKNINDNMLLKKIINKKVKIYPEPSDYLVLGQIEFNDNNFSAAEMMCSRALKINKNYAEAYSALSVIFAWRGNYIAADEIIKNGNTIVQNSKISTRLNIQMRINEAAVSLLKNEKERAYVLLRSVLTVDNNEKADKLYNRYFSKDSKVQN